MSALSPLSQSGFRTPRTLTSLVQCKNDPLEGPKLSVAASIVGEEHPASIQFILKFAFSDTMLAVDPTFSRLRALLNVHKEPNTLLTDPEFRWNWRLLAPGEILSDSRHPCSLYVAYVDSRGDTRAVVASVRVSDQGAFRENAQIVASAILCALHWQPSAESVLAAKPAPDVVSDGTADVLPVEGGLGYTENFIVKEIPFAHLVRLAGVIDDILGGGLRVKSLVGGAATLRTPLTTSKAVQEEDSDEFIPSSLRVTHAPTTGGTPPPLPDVHTTADLARTLLIERCGNLNPKLDRTLNRILQSDKVVVVGAQPLNITRWLHTIAFLQSRWKAATSVLTIRQGLPIPALSLQGIQYPEPDAESPSTAVSKWLSRAAEGVALWKVPALIVDADRGEVLSANLTDSREEKDITIFPDFLQVIDIISRQPKSIHLVLLRAFLESWRTEIDLTATRLGQGLPPAVIMLRKNDAPILMASVRSAKEKVLIEPTITKSRFTDFDRL